jgi:hypothetical protein
MYNSFFFLFFPKTIWSRYDDSNWSCSGSFSVCFSDSCSSSCNIKRQMQGTINMSSLTRSSQDILLSAEVKSNIPVSWEQGAAKQKKKIRVYRSTQPSLPSVKKKCILIVREAGEGEFDHGRLGEAKGRCPRPRWRHVCWSWRHQVKG